MKTVYIETSVFSYLTSRPSRDLLASACQQITEQWWHDRRHFFDLFVSPAVEAEARKGDSEAAERRLSAMTGIPRLAVNLEAEALAEELIRNGAVPKTATNDALHVALAAVHGIDYLLTWNCRHIDNAERKPLIRATCTRLGYACPEICTPEQLMGGLSNER
jgi:predicted nucleic acid-binding protein